MFNKKISENTCIFCGAPNNGTNFCIYCGGSLNYKNENNNSHPECANVNVFQINKHYQYLETTFDMTYKQNLLVYKNGALVNDNDWLLLDKNTITLYDSAHVGDLISIVMADT